MQLLVLAVKLLLLLFKVTHRAVFQRTSTPRGLKVWQILLPHGRPGQQQEEEEEEGEVQVQQGLLHFRGRQVVCWMLQVRLHEVTLRPLLQ